MSYARQGFKITGGKGFHVTFDNGYTASVQFGWGSYSDNYDADSREPDANIRCGEEGSSTAECAVWAADGNLINHFDDNCFSNRSSPAQVLELLNWAAAQPNSNK